MSQVIEEFAHSLEKWRHKYAGQPKREMQQLLLLGLEREEIVAVGYRETLILRRLKSMPIAPEVQELIHHAVVWAWKDEQMHAIYLRGAILQLGSPKLRLRAFLRQMAGLTGGWAASLRQHIPWSHAPLSHTLDLVAARHMGLINPRQASVLNTACHWFGDPGPQTQVIGPDIPLPEWRGPYHNEWTTLLSLLAYPVYEFASGRGALFVPEMDQQAFPPLVPESLLLHLRRRSLQLLLGLRHP